MRLSMSRPLVALALLSVPPATLAAQAPAAAIAGVVVTERGVPIEQATVTIFGTPGSFSTGARGRFAVPAIPPGNYMLAVRRIGYAPVVFPISARPGVTDTLRIEMEAAVSVLPDVQVEERYAGLDKRHEDMARRLDHGLSLVLAADGLTRYASLNDALAALLPPGYQTGSRCLVQSLNGFMTDGGTREYTPFDAMPVVTRIGLEEAVAGGPADSASGPRAFEISRQGRTAPQLPVARASISNPAGVPIDMLSAIEFVPPQNAATAFGWAGSRTPCGVVVLWQ